MLYKYEERCEVHNVNKETIRSLDSRQWSHD